MSLCVRMAVMKMSTLANAQQGRLVRVNGGAQRTAEGRQSSGGISIWQTIVVIHAKCATMLRYTNG